MFLDKDLNYYKESDIDVYVMENNEIPKNTWKLINFLNDNFKIQFQKINNCTSILNCIIDGCSRILQIISTQFTSINEIFQSFDMGYIKCGLYLGQTIVTYDAIYSKNTNTTHIKFPNKNRIIKTRKKNMEVYGHNEIYDINDDNLVNKNLNEISYDEIEITPLKNFIIGYQQMKNYIDCVSFNEINDIDIIDIKQTQFKNIPIIRSYKIMPLLMICQINSNYNTTYVNKMPIITQVIKFNICGKLYKCPLSNNLSIKIFDKNSKQFKKLNKLINQLNKIIKLKKSDFNIKSRNCLESQLNCKFRHRIKTKDIDMKNTIFYCENENDLYIKSSMIDDHNYGPTGLYINAIKTNIDNGIIDKVIANNENKMFKLYMTFRFEHKMRQFHHQDNHINCIYISYELVKISDIV